MAAIPEDVEAVLEFLRKNGFAEAENALRQDINERNQLGTFDFEKFLFPMPPPVKIPPIFRPPDSAGDSGCDGSRSAGGGSSSADEFLSLVSSTKFVNPYGEGSSSGAGSDASSDRLSQFDTARTYTEWNEFYCHDEDNKEEDEFMSPAFRESDFFICLSEDKFIMSSETDNQFENTRGGVYDKSEGSQTEASLDCLDKPCLLNMLCNSENEDTEEADEKGYDVLDKCKEPERGYFDEDPLGYCYEDSQGKDVNEIFDQAKGILDYENGDDMKAETQEEAEVTDELLMSRDCEDEYEVFDLRIIHRKNRTGFEENKDLPIVLNTVIGGRYYVTEYLGSAAFSKVVQAHDLRNGIDVCLKIIKNDKDFFDQSLDEIKLLKYVNKHDPSDKHHILRLYDYFYHQEHLFIVCELLRANLYEYQKFNQESGGEPYFNMRRLQYITRQCLDALVYLHGLGIIHCDLKPENILIKSYRRCEIKIIDLGSSCFRHDNLCLYVQSRSYRAPEVILGLPYDEKIDLWSLGCILAELCSGEVLFPNEDVATILARMVGILGPIDVEMLEKGQDTYKYFTREYDLYHVNEESDDIEYIIPEELALEDRLQDSDTLFVDFLRKLLEINPLRRPSASHALTHPWLSLSL
ncbi:PREDICTED: dual specificity tyrosine-phosphorylation-regulated kinase 2-like isoform X2 [Tarenaya hassleriana]|uniref:dual specificity tyrosine-phosphorylation-regulated kinase 2-like isoform X2 n=1 Tax=Tarenaya hassleriana TaxID=28532 RepID=UPI00053C7DB8|nr:PREDICTED: dual specificity tyrosine-phosphorylation-regulated kinase 2-like isoform X2 [Tarenaya hassleriana]